MAIDTKLNFSTTFYPQTNGQSKRTIHVLEDMLQACVLDVGKNWEKMLPLIEFAYNDSYYVSLGMASYEVLYG